MSSKDLATGVEVLEVFDAAALAAAMEMDDVLSVALDASGPDELAEAVPVAGHRPVLRPLWRRVRNGRGEIDEVFDGNNRMANTIRYIYKY